MSKADCPSLCLVQLPQVSIGHQNVMSHALLLVETFADIANPNDEAKSVMYGCPFKESPYWQQAEYENFGFRDLSMSHI